MLREKTENLLAGEGGRDIFTLLGRRRWTPLVNVANRLAVKANMGTEAKNKMTEEEVLAQMRYAAWFDLCLAVSRLTTSLVRFCLRDMKRYQTR